MNTGRAAIPRAMALPILLVVILLVSAGSSRPARAYEHRSSTPSFGLQIGYGRLFGSETFTIPNWPVGNQIVPATFDLSGLHDQWGPSAHVTVRFVLDRSHALGFGFDDLRYKRHGGFNEAEREALPKWVKFTTFHADYYLYFQRRQRLCSYIAPSLGIQQRELRFRGSEVGKQEFRLLYGAAAGVEYFIRRSVSVDAATHVYGLRGGNGTSVSIQPALGIQIYVI